MSAGAISHDLTHGGVAAWVRARPVVVGLVACLALVVLLVLGVGLGTVRISPAETIGVILSKTLGIDIGVSWTDATEVIVWDLRLPRVLTAMVVGAGLAVAGATFQGLLRNPLADPYVLGTASGAALGAAIAVLLPIQLGPHRVRVAARPRLRRGAAGGLGRVPPRRYRQPPVA